MGQGRKGDRYRAGLGPPLLLLHGLGGTWHAWRSVLDALTPHCDVLALTLPGHLGAPSLPESMTPTADTLCDWLAAELDREGIGAVHVVGNSLGGWLALELARRGRALSVVVLAPIGFLEPREADRLIRRLRASRAAASLLGPIARGLARLRLGRRLLLGDVLHDPAALSPEDAQQWIDAFVGCSAFDVILDAIAAHPPAPLPASLGCPVCIAWPAEDRLTPERTYAKRFAEALPDATRVLLPSSGHIPMPEAPQQIAALILEHVRRCSRPVEETSSSGEGV